MSTIEEQLRAEILKMTAELAKYEKALAILTAETMVKVPESLRAKFPEVFNELEKDSREKAKPLSVNEALMTILANGPLPRRDILEAIEVLRPGTTGQTISSALNGLKKTGKVKLKGGKWMAV